MTHENKGQSLAERLTQGDTTITLDELKNFNMTDREREVLTMRYGIGTPKMTRTEVAEHFSLTLERVRQIEEKALRRIARGESRIEPFSRLLTPDFPSPEPVEEQVQQSTTTEPNGTDEECKPRIRVRQLKLTRITHTLPPSMGEYLQNEHFSLEEFMNQITESEQLIAHDWSWFLDSLPHLIEIFQDLERGCALAISHLRKGESYEDLIEHKRGHGMEINHIRWLVARDVVPLVQEYTDSGVPLRELLIAAMQGVKNAAFAYNFSPDKSFIAFAIPIIHKHIKRYIQTGKLPYTRRNNAYRKQHAKAIEAYYDYRRAHYALKDFIRQHSPKHLEHLFANAKMGRSRREVIETAELAEQNTALIAIHLPDDYEQRDKHISTPSYMVQDVLHSGECKDLVKPVGGEWSLCTAPDGERIAISTITDRESLHHVMEALVVILKEQSEVKPMELREWRAVKGW